MKKKNGIEINVGEMGMFIVVIASMIVGIGFIVYFASPQPATLYSSRYMIIGFLLFIVGIAVLEVPGNITLFKLKEPKNKGGYDNEE